MTLVNRQTYTVTLPDGSQPGIISGSLTLDDSYVPYAHGIIVIPTPDNTSQLDPRSSGSGQPPRVTIGMFQEFAESVSFDDMSNLFPTQSFDDMSALYPTQTFDDMSDMFTTEWNVGNAWAGRPAVYRKADLAVIEAETNDDGTTTLQLSSDEAYALGAAGTQLATWGAVGDTKLTQLVAAALSAIMPVTLQSVVDLDLSSAIAASPSQPVYTDNVWDGLDTYIQLAAARLYSDENRVWHLGPNIVPLVPTTVYTQGFESGVDSFSVGAQSTAAAHSGTHSLAFASISPSADLTSKRTLTGLTVGASYKVSAWTSNPNYKSYTVYAQLAVTGIGASDWSPALGTAWSLISYSFTATATSHEIGLHSKTNPT